MKENRASLSATTAQILTAAVVATVLAVSFGGRRDAEAFPAYATKENKKCDYCHVKATGGGKRTAAGDYYKAHGLSFAGYKPANATKPTKPAGAATPAPAKAKTPPSKGTKPTTNNKPTTNKKV